jgi:hypothetical protein
VGLLRGYYTFIMAGVARRGTEDAEKKINWWNGFGVFAKRGKEKKWWGH